MTDKIENDEKYLEVRKRMDEIWDMDDPNESEEEEVSRLCDLVDDYEDEQDDDWLAPMTADEIKEYEFEDEGTLDLKDGETGLPLDYVIDTLMIDDADMEFTDKQDIDIDEIREVYDKVNAEHQRIFLTELVPLSVCVNEFTAKNIERFHKHLEKVMAVQAGIEDAKAGRLKEVDLEADAEFADSIPDDEETPKAGRLETMPLTIVFREIVELGKPVVWKAACPTICLETYDENPVNAWLKLSYVIAQWMGCEAWDYLEDDNDEDWNKDYNVTLR